MHLSSYKFLSLLNKKYYLKDPIATNIGILIDFFNDDVKISVSVFIHFLDDKIRTEMNNNAVSLEKDGDFVLLDYNYHTHSNGCLDTFRIHKDDFIKMLLRWEELYKQKSDEIIITQDDQEKISMIGKFNDGREI